MIYLLPEWRPHFFWVYSDSKVWCLNLETNQVVFVLQVRDALLVKVKHIVDHDG